MSKILSLDNCKVCEYHKDIRPDNSVRCGRLKDIIGYVLIIPSNWNKGFKNGELIVHCNKEYV